MLGENINIFGASFGDSSELELFGLVDDVTLGLSVLSDDGEPIKQLKDYKVIFG